MNSSSDSLPPTKRPAGLWRAALLLIVVFLTGVGAGVGGGILLVRSQVRKIMIAPAHEPAPIDRLLARMEKDFAADLALDPGQRVALHEEVAKTSRRIKDWRTASFKELREVILESADGVESSVPAEKRKQARERMAARLRRWGIDPANRDSEKGR